MTRNNTSMSCFGLGIVLYILVSVLALPAAFAASASGAGESVDQLYEKAKKDGKLTLYAPLSARSMEVILPGFMKRILGVTVNHIDSTPNQLLARVLAEAGGGRVLADVFGGSLPYMAQISEQKLIAPLTVPEAAVYPANMK